MKNLAEAMSSYFSRLRRTMYLRVRVFLARHHELSTLEIQQIHHTIIGHPCTNEIEKDLVKVYVRFSLSEGASGPLIDLLRKIESRSLKS